MQKFLWILIFFLFGLSITIIVFFIFRNDDLSAYKVSVNKENYKKEFIENDNTDVVSFKNDNLKSNTIINVPYVSEAPEGNWTGDWVNACEEATIAMVDAFYDGKTFVSVSDAKYVLQDLFDKQYVLYGSSKNADASQIHELITKYFDFNAVIKENPTLDEIKKEINEGRPIISLHRGFDLKNPNIPFSPTKSSYHTVVVVGYDDQNSQFIVHDPGDDKDGINHRYNYDVFMNSLHNYNIKHDKTDGLPTVLFTNKK